MNYWTESRENIYVAAHRGWPAKYPENTMESYRAAAELGVDQIENDIRVTKDGELVLIHDAAVDRTTDGHGLVENFTLKELRELDAGGWKGEEFRGLKIPTLVEFMEFVKDYPTMTVDFELKEYPTPGREELAYDVCDRALRIIDDYGFSDRCVINTFDAKLHDYIRKNHDPRLRRHVYYPIRHMGQVEEDPYEGAYCVCMFGDRDDEIMAGQKSFDMVRARGLRPWAGAGVKDAAGVDLAIERGAELVTCNNPDVILALLRERGRHA